MSPKTSQRNTCGADGPIGALVIVIGVFLALVSLISSVAISVLVSLVSMYFVPRSQPAFIEGTSNFGMSEPNPASQVTFYLVMAVILSLCAVLVWCGIGIRRGTQSAFSLTIVLFGLSSLTGNGWAVLSIAIVVYCVLRKLNIIRATAD